MRTFARCASAVIGSPRLSSALPPRATTTFTMLLRSTRQLPSGGDHHGLDRVHPVLGLVPHDGSFGLEHVVRDLHAVEPEALEHLLADLRVAVVEGGEAVHELHLGLPVFSTRSAFTWYGLRSFMRSSQTDLSSPIETHTSV